MHNAAGVVVAVGVAGGIGIGGIERSSFPLNQLGEVAFLNNCRPSL